MSGKAEIYCIERVMLPLGDTAMMKIIWCDGSGTNIEPRLKGCLVNCHISGWPFTGAQSTCVSSVVGGPGIGTTGPASAPGCQNGHCGRLSSTHSPNGMHRVCYTRWGVNHAWINFSTLLGQENGLSSRNWQGRKEGHPSQTA